MVSRRVSIRAHGIVQGVYYRLSMQKTAITNGVTGWVRNMENGDVEGTIEGESDSIERVIEWCRRGPDAARVDSLDVTEENPRNEFTSFDIRD